MTAEKDVLQIENLLITFGGLRAIDNISVHVKEGDFLGIIGPNGAGKTTFFNSITGNIKPTVGSINFCGESLLGQAPDKISHLGISRTFQNIRIFPQMTVLENVCIPLHSKPQYGIFAAMLGLPSAKKKDKALQEEALGYLESFGILEYKDQRADSLPYGLQRRLEIARALAAHPKLLLLDEPAAGMNNDECEELVRLLQDIHQKYNLTIVLIEHHLDVVFKLCNRIYVFNLGKLLAEGSPVEIQSNPEVISAYLGERRRKA